MTRPFGAPGCFAAASVFASDSATCQKCPVFTECTTASFETLEAIKGIVDVSDLLKRHALAKKKALAAQKLADEATQEGLPPGNLERPVAKTPVERKTPKVAVKFEVTASDDKVLMKMNVKSKEVAVRLIQADQVESIRKGLLEGRNHCAETTKLPWLTIAVRELLAGGFSKRDLRGMYEQELEWTEGTAATHVGMACQLLTGFRWAQEKGGRFTLIPGVTA